MHFVNIQFLAHHDFRPLMLSCDTSPYGLGAVLVQLDGRGEEIPGAFTLRTLRKCERNHSQLDREGLVIVFGFVHFCQYIASRHVLIVIDHKPLLGIMCPGKQIQQVLSPKILRWCGILSAFDYELLFKKGKRHQNADALSILPLVSNVNEECRWAAAENVLMIEGLQKALLNAMLRR